MLVAQISDLHVSTDGSMVRRFMDTNVCLEAAVGALNRFAPRIDHVVISGDLVEDATVPEYEILFDLLDPLEIDATLMPGNHDDARLLARLAPPRYRLAGMQAPLHQQVDLGELVVLAVDTSHVSTQAAVFDESHVAWLDDRLRDLAGRPVIVFTHHPPFATGIGFMDRFGMTHESRRLLRMTLEAHPNVLRLASGHIHRSIHTSLGGVPVSVCPSTAHHIGLGLDGLGAWLSAEQPGFHLHWYDGEALTTHLAPVDDVKTFDLGDI